MSVPRVVATPEAEAWLEKLRAIHGPLMFHQSGCCCDGSSPMCHPEGEFQTGGGDIKLGEVAGCEFFIGKQQYAAWKDTQIIIDVVPGRGSGFSVEAPEGIRFLTRWRGFTDGELAALQESGGQET